MTKIQGRHECNGSAFSYDANNETTTYFTEVDGYAGINDDQPVLAIRSDLDGSVIVTGVANLKAIRAEINKALRNAARQGEK